MNATDDPLDRAEELLGRLEAARSRLETTDDPQGAIEAELQRARASAEAHEP